MSVKSGDFVMREKCIMNKRMLAIFLVVIMGINCFAAVVSDNDGAAFITKAEFDSLKIDFQNQLNKNNSLINSKIDDAISKYLSGVRVTKDPINLIERFEKVANTKMTWLYKLPGTGSSTRTSEVNIQSTGYLTRRSVSNFVFHAGVWLSKSDRDGSGRGGGYPYSAVMFGEHTFDTSSAFANWALAASKTGWQYLEDIWVLLPSSWTNYYAGTGGNTGQATYAVYNETSSSFTQPSSGSGSGWLYQTLAEVPVLKYYCTTIYPKVDLEYYVHWYKYFPASTYTTYTSSTGFSFSDVSIPALGTLQIELGKTKSLGTKYGSGSTNSGKYVSGSAVLVKTTDGNNYLNNVWGLSNATTIYANNEDYNGTSATSDSTTTWPTDLKWNNQYYASNGLKAFQSSYPSTTTKYRGILYTPETKKISDFGNSTLTTIAGEKVMNGHGAPCIDVKDASKNVQVTFKLATTTGTASCNIVLSDGKFNNGSVSSGSANLVSTSTSTGVERTISFRPRKEGIVYIFIKNNTNTNPIVIDKFTCK